MTGTLELIKQEGVKASVGQGDSQVLGNVALFK